MLTCGLTVAKLEIDVNGMIADTKDYSRRQDLQERVGYNMLTKQSLHKVTNTINSFQIIVFFYSCIKYYLDFHLHIQFCKSIVSHFALIAVYQ